MKKAKDLTLPKFCNARIHQDYSDSDVNFCISKMDVIAAFNYYLSIGNYSKEKYSGHDSFMSNYFQMFFIANNIFVMYINQKLFEKSNIEMVSYKQLEEIISEKEFLEIPEIKAFNEIPNGNFIHLGAFARNVFYMILRNALLDNESLFPKEELIKEASDDEIAKEELIKEETGNDEIPKEEIDK